mmetsp:Transcript_481/g.753  ORF Transcript_481/g.753 Transcript_481/m.753 type:complete len:208 (-) Transcript_481:299-922(-)
MQLRSLWNKLVPRHNRTRRHNISRRGIRSIERRRCPLDGTFGTRETLAEIGGVAIARIGFFAGRAVHNAADALSAATHDAGVHRVSFRVGGVIIILIFFETAVHNRGGAIHIHDISPVERNNSSARSHAGWFRHHVHLAKGCLAIVRLGRLRRRRGRTGRNSIGSVFPGGFANNLRFDRGRCDCARFLRCGGRCVFCDGSFFGGGAG